MKYLSIFAIVQEYWNLHIPILLNWIIICQTCIPVCTTPLIYLTRGNRQLTAVTINDRSFYVSLLSSLKCNVRFHSICPSNNNEKNVRHVAKCTFYPSNFSSHRNRYRFHLTKWTSSHFKGLPVFSYKLTSSWLPFFP